MSCATFVRKAFVSSTPVANPEEVVGQGVDLDDVLYCSKLYKRSVSISKIACSCCNNVCM